MQLILVCLLVVLQADLAPAQDGSFRRHLAALGHEEGARRQEAQRWLVEKLEPGQVGTFLAALENCPPEVRLRGLAVLSARQDLFPAAAGLLLTFSPRVPRHLVMQAVGTLGTAALKEPGQDDRTAFRPLPDTVAVMDGRQRDALALVGLLARVVELPLPLLLWPGGEEKAWRPGYRWGGDLRRLLDPRAPRLPWFGGATTSITPRVVMILRPGARPATDPADFIPRLVLALGGTSHQQARDAALSLGLLPCPPLGSFFLDQAGSAPLGSPLRLGLAVHAGTSGYLPPLRARIRPLLLAELASAQGENLAWATRALARLPAGWGAGLAQAASGLERGERWRFLLPLLAGPLPGCHAWLTKALAEPATSPREAALLLRAAARQGLPVSPARVRTLCRLAGPGCGRWAAKLLLPLEKGQEKLLTADLSRQGQPALVELAAFALALSPAPSRRLLVDGLARTTPPVHLPYLLRALERASWRGAPELGSLLLARFDRATGRQRLIQALALCRVLRTGPYLGLSSPELARKGLPLESWRLRQQVEQRLGRLLRALQPAFQDPGEPLGREVGRSLGRLLGLWQSMSLHQWLPALKDQRLRERLLVLLREMAALSPLSRRVLRYSALPPDSVPYQLLAQGLLPPVGTGMDLVAADPLSWARAFSLAGGEKELPGGR